MSVLRNLGEAHLAARERIYEHIVEAPGICFADLAKRTGYAFGHVQYHLYVLRKLGAITTHRVGRYVRHYAVGQVTPAEQARDAIARDANLSAILGLTPGASQALVAAILGRSRQAAAYHLRRLQRHGPRGRRHPT